METTVVNNCLFVVVSILIPLFGLNTEVYSDGQHVVFTQELPQGANNTNASNPVFPAGTDVDNGAHPPIVSFPSFLLGGRLASLGFVSWSGAMSGVISGTNISANVAGLKSSGPVVLFDGAYRTFVVSPLDNFKS
ncbi:unnamed protein product, partial [Polarella glacialis]